MAYPKGMGFFFSFRAGPHRQYICSPGIALLSYSSHLTCGMKEGAVLKTGLKAVDKSPQGWERVRAMSHPSLRTFLGYVSVFRPTDATSTAAPVPATEVDVSQEVEQVFEPADNSPSRSEAAAVQPVIGISQRVQMNSKEKKDLGTLGYVLGLIMMVIIIAIGAGIVVGYIYKRGKDLKEKHEQKVYEREMQRITLPLSAFTNPACELVDENTIVVHTNETPVEDTHDGSGPLMGQAGTPGA
uniref:Phosphoinositide-3-kinase interacting protein 1 n=1 Tax=Apteryx owenii TaxID=8824 RepID=A0A8B9PWJ7_APTOW